MRREGLISKRRWHVPLCRLNKFDGVRRLMRRWRSTTNKRRKKRSLKLMSIKNILASINQKAISTVNRREI